MGVKKLRFLRDVEEYTAWWSSRTDDEKEAITDALESIRKSTTSRDFWQEGMESALSSLFYEVFQGDRREHSGLKWLRVEGLRPGTEVNYLTLDIDPAYDGEGMLYGVTVVAHLHATPIEPDSFTSFMSVQAYVEKPRGVFDPTPGLELDAAVAEIVDEALSEVNWEIAERDKFTNTVRDWDNGKGGEEQS